jgi:D-hexose-6-phosphate mutarotase
MSTIPGLRFGEFQGFPALLISTPFSKAAISLFGGHVLSYVPQGFDDVLWLSPISKLPCVGRTSPSKANRPMHRSMVWCAQCSGS